MILKNVFLSILKIYLIPISSLLFITILYAGCNKDDNYSTNGGSGNPGPNEVFIENSSFTPSNRTISVGTTITWKNQDGIGHTVTSGIPGSPSGLFNSGNLGNGASFSYTFNNPGEYKYFCNIHPSMTAKVTVQ
ncbi:MAG: hypothetical protein A2V93_03515 [Ignavibacteria bacterium RBG_16_34_14]|nr:MAG: hypothetical protein A2V93_03515 [Ignavibacteria bacterium RBG_16_34_14]